MKKTLIRTAVITSLITALAVSAVAYLVMPRPASVQAGSDQGVTLPPSNANTQAADNSPARPALIRRPSPAHRVSSYYQDQSQAAGSGSYSEPVIRHHRSTEKSVAIVAGSAGAGAAIGALAGGGRGAAIGALSGGAAGFIFDRMTANK